MSIALLKNEVINKIAAGEVVERPVSIVRELVDNAIDASATSIVVEIEEGGQSLVRVSDDGIGMSESEAELCFQRHATSKIRAIEDLESISSLGFRGEALSSIAAVAHVKLRTRTSQQELAHEVVVHDSKVLSKRHCAGPVGSEFEVSKLFASLPARKKFLKSPRSDLVRIQEWIYQSALAHPQVRYRLIADGKEILRLGSSGDIFGRLESLLVGSTIRIDFQAGPFQVRGLVAHPSQAKYQVGGFVFLVNGRPIQDRMLMKSLREAWSTGIRPGEFPVGALEILLPPSEVDVNVHPQKGEVRFRNSQAVFASLYRAVKSGLAEWKPQFSIEEKGIAPQFQISYVQSAEDEGRGTHSLVKEAVSSNADQAQGSFYETNTNYKQPGVVRFSEERYIGQILGVFLLFERADRTFIIDAHAAHERVRYNHLMAWAKKKAITSQRLLVPEQFALGALEVASLLEKKEALQEFGIYFQAEGDSISLLEMPTSIVRSEYLLLLKSLAETTVVDVGAVLQQVVEKTLARTACRSSVMSGVRLLPSEAQSLWEQIKTEPQGAVCPHGRPVMVELPRAVLDKLFFRSGF